MLTRVTPVVAASGFALILCLDCISRSEPEGAVTSAETPRQTCEERRESASLRVEAERVKHLECTQDSDCTIIDPSTQCGGRCPQPVLMNGLEPTRAVIEDVNETICKDYAAQGCPFATPGCAPIAAVCDAGRCTGTTP